MTLESTNNRNRYIGNGATTVFPFTFKVWKKSQVAVFTGDGTAEQDVSAQCSVIVTASGGTVSFPSPPASGTVIVIRRGMPFTQEDDYRNGARFDGEEVEDRFDMDCAERQDLRLDVSRAVKVPETSQLGPEAFWGDLATWRQDCLDALATAGDVTGATLVTASGSTTPRSIAQRLADVVNAKDFGARGDGVTDDAEAINAALAAGGVVYLPAGTYKVGAPIGIPSNTMLIGAGKGITTIVSAADMDLMYHTVCTANCVDIAARGATDDDVDELCPYNVEHAGLFDLTVDANCYNRTNSLGPSYPGYEPGTAVEFQRCRWCEISGVEAVNGPQHCINVRAGTGSYNKGVGYIAKYPSQYVTIRHCNTDNQARDDSITTHDSEYIYIYDCRVFLTRNTDGTNEHPVSNGIEIDDGSRYVWVEDCLSDGGIAGYQAKGHANTPPAHHVWFTNCIARNVHDGWSISAGTDVGAGVIEASCHDVFLEGCAIENCYQKTGMTSWAGEAHYIHLTNARNVCVTNLSVNGKTHEPENYSEMDRLVYFRLRGGCENVLFKNVFLQNVNDNANSDTALFLCSGSSTNISIHNVLCDAYQTGALVNASGGGANLSVKSIRLMAGSSSFYAVLAANTKNTEIVDVRASGSKGTALLGGHFAVQSGVRERDARYSDVFTDSTAEPVKLVGVVSDEEETLLQGTTVNLPFIMDYAGSGKRVGAVACRTRAVSDADDPANAGTYIALYCLATDDSFVPALHVTSTHVAPSESRDDAESVGTASARFSTVYAATGSINTSDARLKTGVASIPDAAFRAWGKVGFKLFQFIGAVEEKGAEAARLHVGVIAQEVAEAFESEGLDASRFGLFCYDEWEDAYEEKFVVDAEPVFDDDGNEVVPAEKHVERTLVRPAGSRYSIRYDEALALECAYQRWRLEQIEARLASLEVQ